jgi:hypothetical protein
VCPDVSHRRSGIDVVKKSVAILFPGTICKRIEIAT